MSSVSLPSSPAQASPSAPAGLSAQGPRVTSLRHRVTSYLSVIYALMMHDIKNRFFGSGIGQIILVFWPFIHITVLLTVYVVTKRTNPYGSSIIQYSAVSLFPFICFNYMTRWIVYSTLTNRSFLQYPIIKTPGSHGRPRPARDRQHLAGRHAADPARRQPRYDAVPWAPDQAVYAACATIFLSIGLGFVNGAIAFVIPIWNLILIVLIISMYLSSGIVFLPSQMPEQIQYYLSFNPLLHCVEWMRTAYYPDYPTQLLDRTYVLEFSLVSLTLGLILERLLRRLI